MSTSALGRGRVGVRFSAVADHGRPAFIPYLTVGYPSLGTALDLARGLADAGADVLELGIPYSDPMADGPTIQRSSQHALDAGTTVDDVFRVVQDLRSDRDVPIVLFTYVNAVYHRGVNVFIEDALDAGADGILATDLPLDADPDVEELLESSALDLVRLIAPTTSESRARRIANRSQGFVYYISKTGVTGASPRLSPDLEAEIQAVKAASKVPVAVGFGVSTPGQAATLGRVADGVVVGSALVDALSGAGVEGAVRLAGEIRAGLDRCRE